MAVTTTNLTPVRGFQPVEVPGRSVEPRLIPKKATTTEDVGNGSPIWVESGYAETCGNATSSKWTGVVLQCYDSNMQHVQNLPKATAGFVSITDDPDLRYRAAITTATGVAFPGDVGDYFCFADDEAIVVATSRYSGAGTYYSTRGVLGSSEHASDGPIKVLTLFPGTRNTAGQATVEAIVGINPTNYVA